jgi:hypothetical protein
MRFSNRLANVTMSLAYLSTAVLSTTVAAESLHSKQFSPATRDALNSSTKTLLNGLQQLTRQVAKNAVELGRKLLHRIKFDS